ncbi:alpha/beta hydrolase [Candidatus Pacearchaeota archaeon]|nr:alpha/beta hydrolase [Candidatus Pacearchaeota archaeon]
MAAGRKKQKGGIVNNSVKIYKKHTAIHAFAYLLGAMLLSLLAVQAFLYIRFVLGNDIVLSLSADKNDISLEHGQNATLNLDIKGIANPLCRIECNSEFFDISGNKSVEAEQFRTISQVARKKAYTLKEMPIGTGQKLYRFSITCGTIKGFLCHTRGMPTTRSILVTAEYSLNEEEKAVKNKLKKEIESKAVLFLDANESLEKLDSEIGRYSNTLTIAGFGKSLEEARGRARQTAEFLDDLPGLWQQQDFSALSGKIIQLISRINEFQSASTELNEIFIANISLYNALAEKLFLQKQKLEILKEKELNETHALELAGIIRDFNQNIIRFASETGLAEKGKIAGDISGINLQKFSDAVYGNETKEKANETIIFGIEKITLNLTAEKQQFVLEEPKTECCVFGKCRECSFSKKAYPVIFLHGHDFNKGVSAFYSLNAFSELQKKLEENGYINAGEISLSTAKRKDSGMLGLSGMPVTFRASYYFDVFKMRGTYIPVQTKSESIETYSIKLRDIIENVKYETSQQRVIIIAHSMGGLVARKYMQLFGNSSIEKLVLVNVPNKGITGNAAKYCSMFGADLECRDMNSDSLFLNKLNAEATEAGIYNIIGTGCKMEESIGDGIVLEENAFLENADNYMIKGTCSGTNLLHGELLDISKHQEFYDLILDILKG